MCRHTKSHHESSARTGELVLYIIVDCRLIGGHQDSLLFQHLRKLAVLMHRHQDITAADKLFRKIELRNGRPIRVFFNAYSRRPWLAREITTESEITGRLTLAQLGILEHVESDELLGVDTLQA